MPNRSPAEALERVLEAVANLHQPGSLEDIEQALKRSQPSLSLPRRTLQRRLATLVAQGRLHVEGQKRGARYSPADSLTLVAEERQKPTVTAELSASHLAAQNELTVSPAGAAVRRAVRGPLHGRKPVGYNREFLDAYRPQQSAYLSHTLRRHLATVGHTPSGDLPAGTYARQILHRLLIDLSWNSSRLEGNTYSLLETERLLELGESAEGKAAQDAQMILNHKAAIEMLVEDAAHIGFNRYTLLNLHALLADNLLANAAAGGRLRTIPVTIGGTVFHPLEVPQLIEECFDQVLATATAIADPFEQAFFAMVHLPYLQPFEDVNKRVSRLAANIPLIRLNLCPLSFVDVPVQDYIDGTLGVYELNRIDLLRDVFVWAYERSGERYSAVRRSLGDPDPFRLKYRSVLREIVGDVIRGALDKGAAARFIRAQAVAVAAEDRDRLTEVAETELQSLHEGNFARYRVRPSEFEAWRKAWR